MTTLAPTPNDITSDHEAAAQLLLDDLVKVLGQFRDVLGALGDAQYTQRPIGPIESSIGSHVRHCLDHLRELLQGWPSGILNYDVRERGTAVESDRLAAMRVIARYQQHLMVMPRRAMDRTLGVTVMSHGGGESLVRSSVARELWFVLSHTIHHAALIAVMVKLLGGSLPEGFGYAPSTLAHREKQACALSA